MARTAQPEPDGDPDAQALFQRLRQGDRAAAGELHDRYAARLYGFIRARVAGDRDVAADIYQETFVSVVKDVHRVERVENLWSWLLGVARHKLADFYRRQVREEAARRALTVLETPEPSHDFRRLESREQLLAGLRKLNPIHQRVLCLKYLDGQTTDQIALELNRTPKAVESLIDRARLALRAALAEDA